MRLIRPIRTRPIGLHLVSGTGTGSRQFDSLTAPRSGFVDELQVLGFPHTCHPSYGGLAPTPAGFTFLLNTLAFIGHTEFLDNTGALECGGRPK